MNINILLTKLIPIKNFVVRYAVIIFVVCVALVFGFMTLKIAGYSNDEPRESQIEERLSSLKTVKLDEEAMLKIEELEDQNINLESLFNNGRENPFE